MNENVETRSRLLTVDETAKRLNISRPTVYRKIAAGHRSMATTNQYVHLAGVVFRDEADALEQRLLGGVAR